MYKIKNTIKLFLIIIIGLVALTGCSTENTTYAQSTDFKKITVINVRTNKKIIEIIGNVYSCSINDDKIRILFKSFDDTKVVEFKNSENIFYIIEDIEDTFDNYIYYESKYFYDEEGELNENL